MNNKQYTLRASWNAQIAGDVIMERNRPGKVAQATARSMTRFYSPRRDTSYIARSNESDTSGVQITMIPLVTGTVTDV